MKQDAFEARYEPVWKKFESWIRILSEPLAKRSARGDELDSVAQQFPTMYRQVCHHLAVARTRRYSLALQQRLNQLALEGHQQLYRSRLPFLSALGLFFARDFPTAFRRYWRYMLVASLAFYLPIVAMAAAVLLNPELIYSLLEPSNVATMEEMYDPANDVLGRERQSDTDVQMFGYYIYNNISIGFQTFAGGMLFGLGSLFYLIFNGLYFGAVATHLSSLGFTETFWSFVAGHSALELTAITIFGGVGLMLGYGGIAPGRKARWHAIRDQARNGLPLVYGGTSMLIAAAFVEAFWSSTTWPPVALKYAVGLAMWLSVALYFWLLGHHES